MKQTKSKELPVTICPLNSQKKQNLNSLQGDESCKDISCDCDGGKSINGFSTVTDNEYQTVKDKNSSEPVKGSSQNEAINSGENALKETSINSDSLRGYWEKELEKIQEEIEKVKIANNKYDMSYEADVLSGRKSQLIRDKEEHKKKMEELKEKLKNKMHPDLSEIIDKLFTEVVGK